MPKITFIEHDGSEHIVEAQCDDSVMNAATNNMVPGIDADCGGGCACATCHVYVDPSWLAKVGAPDEMEQEMLECADRPKDNSRLSCQITVTDALDGLIVRLPKQQG